MYNITTNLQKPNPIKRGDNLLIVLLIYFLVLIILAFHSNLKKNLFSCLLGFKHGIAQETLEFVDSDTYFEQLLSQNMCNRLKLKQNMQA